MGVKWDGSELGRARRIGIIGGTFDPIHYGHLVAAEECAAVLDLDQILFVPAWQPPHKFGELVSAAADRAAMVALAIAGNPRFALSTIEIDRQGISYTVDTLRALEAEMPGRDLTFILGLDTLSDLPDWHDPEGVVRAASIVAVSRPGYPDVDLGELDSRVAGASQRVRIVPIPGHDISSTELRERFAQGRPVRYLLPDSVIAYVTERGLYRG